MAEYVSIYYWHLGSSCSGWDGVWRMWYANEKSYLMQSKRPKLPELHCTAGMLHRWFPCWKAQKSCQNYIG